MAHIDTTPLPRSRLPRAPLTGLPGVGGRMSAHSSRHQPIASTLGLSSSLSHDSSAALAPSKEKSVVFVYSQNSGTTLSYIESTLKQLSLKNTAHDKWNYGVLVDDSDMQPWTRIRINGEAIDSELYTRHSMECAQAVSNSSKMRLLSAKDRAIAIFVSAALQIFSHQKVTTIAISTLCPREAPGAASSKDRELDPASSKTAAESNLATDPQENDGSVEKLIVEVFRPKIVICGFEPLPTYWEHMPERWRKGLVYLMRRQAHVISSLQPKMVRMQLHGLAKIFGITIELAQPLTSFQACKDIQLGIFGSEQHQYASLALSLCQSWAFRHGILRSRTQTQGSSEYAVAMALSPVRTSAKLVPQSPYQAQIQSTLRDTPQWMLRGLTSASNLGYFYTPPPDTSSNANWHYSWAETPAEFSRTGSWFSRVCKHTPSNPRLLLVHLPESFIKTVQHQRETDGQWQTSDYRELLHSLYMPLCKIKWTCCVFAADILHESNVMDSSVPPVLSQYVLRDFWAQLSGLRTDQIYIAPSLVSALQLIASKCATHAHSFLDNPGKPNYAESATIISPSIGSRSTLFEHPSTPKASQLIQPSPSASNLLAAAATARPARVFSRTAALKTTASFENLQESRRKQPFGFGGSIGDSTASLPLKASKRMAPLLPSLPLDASPTVSDAPKVEVLVTGSKSFVHSTIAAAAEH
ncbi:hypothetical protein GGI25_001540 [Coemansia spiralis]|uniref:Uncharacterized protein n=2 Tax=Coemansia TaxID=4863 RepID=A0A9W8L084_9FUNG|nr:hypothetical protein BX070DRAFT_235915 [Coemansia spiralis]KAJ1993650.1 hypothetical protein EDC05_002043 [Coemansia umbellata]KAJ2622983.1 hypothetical protein GGI26_002784 [Coemansia sp. RSA 1358]KAJ2679405.1 hypothetical protein GGI25_001540 [Coemansia spiralis]